jgi:hypothetical protein
MSLVRHLAACGLVLCALAAGAIPALARVDLPAGDADTESLTASPLRLKSSQSAQPPNIIILQQEYTVPRSFAGGCFNCPTANSNRGNLSHLLSHAQDFNQGGQTGPDSGAVSPSSK